MIKSSDLTSAQRAALGITKAKGAPRGMNKTESAYADWLEIQRRGGWIKWFKFEGIRLRLADGAFFKVDFAVVMNDGTWELHETKGWERESSIVRFKVAAELYPHFVFRMFKLVDGNWVETRTLNKPAENFTGAGK